MSTTPSALVADLLDALDRWAEEHPDPAERVAEFRAASQHSTDVVQAIAAHVGRAMRDYVDHVGGATAASRELGISRNRVYMLMRHAEQ